ncbi:hypothetical protein Scep_003484 [Stephania cephalantha]|uniref:5'-nucleotidase n=1 Tax=Stephania cephalantha TaxID=152367 RepID=A0AAP0PVT7_9MAGN
MPSLTRYPNCDGKFSIEMLKVNTNLEPKPPDPRFSVLDFFKTDPIKHAPLPSLQFWSSTTRSMDFCNNLMGFVAIPLPPWPPPLYPRSTNASIVVATSVSSFGSCSMESLGKTTQRGRCVIRGHLMIEVLLLGFLTATSLLRIAPPNATQFLWILARFAFNNTPCGSLSVSFDIARSAQQVFDKVTLANVAPKIVLLMTSLTAIVIADFDATLTRYWINGQRGHCELPIALLPKFFLSFIIYMEEACLTLAFDTSEIASHGLLKQENAEYDLKREKLYEYYHPLEYSPTIPIEQKAKLMEEWWEKAHGLLIEGGLTYNSIRKSVADATIAFREGVVELFEFLEEKNVPVLIFSAGLADVIEEVSLIGYNIKEVMRQKLHRSFRNVKIVSNRMVFDDAGRLVSFKGVIGLERVLRLLSGVTFGFVIVLEALLGHHSASGSATQQIGSAEGSKSPDPPDPELALRSATSGKLEI